jgi:hypothetical protein
MSTAPGGGGDVARRAVRAVVALALVAAPVWVVATTGDAVRHQHWALAAVLAGSLLAGLAVALTTVLDERRRASAPRPARGVARRLVAGAGLLALLALAAVVVWLRPFPATSPALAALGSDDVVEVREGSGWIAFVPREAEAATGLVYSPGARVDVRATAAVLRPVAEAGHVVVALKEPLGVAFTAPDQSAGAMAAFDSVDRWVVGGHSLGGVVAASFAASHDDTVDGLLLHASYPSGDISAADVAATSVWATNDGLTTPADVEASRADLPAGTRFVEIPGGVHAFFADYGEQPGDGRPMTTRAAAQAQIVDASIEALDRVASAG